MNTLSHFLQFLSLIGIISGLRFLYNSFTNDSRGNNFQPASLTALIDYVDSDTIPDNLVDYGIGMPVKTVVVIAYGSEELQFHQNTKYNIYCDAGKFFAMTHHGKIKRIDSAEWDILYTFDQLN